MATDKRKTKIVYPSYQYRAAYMTVLVAVFVVNFFIIIASLFPQQLGVTVQFNRTAYYVIGIAEILLIGLCWYWSISSTHRIAGPVYAIDREFKKLRGGDLTFRIRLRPNDEFHQAAESINESIEHHCRELVAIKAIVNELDKSFSTETLKRLENALQKMKTTDVEHSGSEKSDRA